MHSGYYWTFKDYIVKLSHEHDGLMTLYMNFTHQNVFAGHINCALSYVIEGLL